MALSADRETHFRAGDQYSYPCAASKTFYKGAIVFLDSSGNAEPATAATGKIIAGISQEQKTSTTAAAENIEVKAGVAFLKNSGSNTLTKANIGDTVYAEDDETVGSLGTSKSAVGMMVDIDTNGVWVAVGQLPTTGLLAANNLSDVGTVATARSNLALDTGDSPTFTGLTLTGAATVALTLGVTGQASLDGGFDLGTGSPVRKFKRTSIAAAAIATLNATPVQLVAAAAGKVHIPVMAIYNYTHVSTVYDGVGAGEDLRIQWQTGTVQAMPDLDTTTDINFGGAASDVCVVHADNAVKQKPVTNDDLEVTILSAEIYAAAGDGTLVIDLYYDEYTV